MQPSRRRHAKNMLHCNILPIDLVYHRPYIEFSRLTRCSVNGYAEKGTAMFASATGNNSALQGSNFFGGVRHFFASLFAAYADRSEEHTSELQSLMRISYAVFCLKTTTHITKNVLRTNRT